jgi:hypothetical protein
MFHYVIASCRGAYRLGSGIAAYRNAFGPGHTAYGNASFHIHPDNLDYADSIYADFDKLSSFYFHGFHS